jgi:hypothetical protein
VISLIRKCRKEIAMIKSKEVVFQLLICFALCIVSTLSFAESKKTNVNVVNTPTVSINNGTPYSLFHSESEVLGNDECEGLSMGYTIPSATEIDTITILCEIPIGQKPSVNLTIGSFSPKYSTRLFVPLTYQTTFYDVDIYSALVTPKLLLPAGTQVILNVVRGPTCTLSTYCEFSL